MLYRLDDQICSEEDFSVGVEKLNVVLVESSSCWQQSTPSIERAGVRGRRRYVDWLSGQMKRPQTSKRVDGDINWIIFSVDYTFINYGPKWAQIDYIIYEASPGDVVEYEFLIMNVWYLLNYLLIFFFFQSTVCCEDLVMVIWRLSILDWTSQQF